MGEEKEGKKKKKRRERKKKGKMRRKRERKDFETRIYSVFSFSKKVSFFSKIVLKINF